MARLLPQWQCRWKWWWDFPYQKGYVMRKVAGSHSAGTGTERCTATEPWSRNLAHLMNSAYMNTQNTVEGEDFSCIFFLRFEFQTSIFCACNTQSNLNLCSIKSLYVQSAGNVCISWLTIHITELIPVGLWLGGRKEGLVWDRRWLGDCCKLLQGHLQSCLQQEWPLTTY